MRRIAYSPEVRVYIQPNEKKENGELVDPIDISKDIIEGSIERRSNDISTARFVLQGRRLGKENDSDSTTSILLSKKIRPMDRIVVYLKKTKPMLVFSGYIDLVPLGQFVPEPVVIEASCSLKRLQYTYWDPTLPNVMQALIQMGMIVQKNESGFNVFQPPGADSTGTGAIEDQGFPKLLSFLLLDVGGWDPKTVFIEPLPQEWLDLVEPMFRTFVTEDQTWESAKEFLDAWLGASGGDSGGGDGEGDNGDDGVFSNPEIDVDKIKSVLKRSNAASWVFEHIDDFIEAGNKYKIDPRFTLAISMLETGWGKELAAKHNIGGLYGGGRSFPSYRDAIFAQAGPIFLSGDVYKGRNTPATIGLKYAPPNAKNDPNGTNKNWPSSVGSIYNSFGGSGGKDAIVKGPEYEKRLKAKNDPSRNPNAPRGTNDQSQLTVYLEAVGSGENNDKFLKGYQKLDFFARGYDSQSSKNRMLKNRELVKKVQEYLDKYIKEEFKFIKDYSPIKVQVVNHSDVIKGWGGDLYLAIDHSDGERDNNIC